MKDFKDLQNGSDIRGTALGSSANLTPEITERIAKGFLLWLSNKTGKAPAQLTISIGRDPRVTGESLEEAFFRALQPYGTTLMDAGLSSTPAMFMSTIFDEYKCDGAVMITASHLPFDRNGFKFFDCDGGLNKGDITDIIIFAESDSVLGNLKPSQPKAVLEIPLIDTYCAHLRRLICSGVTTATDGVPAEKSLTGLKITVDAGNGAGGFFAEKVLAPLGADITSSQFLTPDGTFPNHAPNPEDKNAMASIVSKVKSSKSDLGLIFDTDVDRSSAVDEKGSPISRNAIVALAAALIAKDYPGTTVVTDSITSPHLTDYLENCLGLRHLRYKRGYKNVINKSLQLNSEGIDSQLAIETSGHAAYKENYFLDDGAYLATKIVIAAANLKARNKSISSWLAPLKSPADSVEVRFPITNPDFAAYADKVLADMESWIKEEGPTFSATLDQPNYEGVRITFAPDSPAGSGWCLLRKSLHDPIMPLNIESDKTDGCAQIAEVLRLFLTNYHNLDISKL